MRKRNIIRGRFIFFISIIIFYIKGNGQISSITTIDKAILKNTDKIALYALPKTVFRIECFVRINHQLAGPFAPYSMELIGKRGVVNDQSVWYLDSIQVSSFEVMDPTFLYVVKFSKKIDYKPLNELAQKGLIIFPIQQRHNELNYDSIVIRNQQFNEWNKPLLNFNVDFTDTVYQLITKDSLLIRKPVVRQKSKTLSTYEQAKETVKIIKQIFQHKNDLLLSDDPVPSNEKSLQWLYNELDRIGNEYLKLFTGNSINQHYLFTFYYTPGITNQQHEIFRFSPYKGITTLNDPTGIPVSITVNSTNTLSTLHDYKMLFSGFNTGYIFYRIPEVVDVTISLPERTLKHFQMNVFQYGTIVPWLPAE